MASQQFDLLVFGASGVTGTHVVAQGAERGLSILTVDRDEVSDRALRDGVRHQKADVLNDDLGDIVAQIKPEGGVISCLGVTFGPKTALSPPPLYSEGTAAILEAMRAHGARRLAVISAALVEPDDGLPLWFRSTIENVLTNILDDMRAMERRVENEPDLDYSIARPGWLLDKPLTKTYKTREKFLPEGTIRTRNADLAHLLLTAVIDNQWVRAKPAIGHAEHLFDESILAVSREIKDMAA